MSGTPTPRDAAADPRIGRARPWISALLSAVLHALMLALLLWAATPTVTPPQGAASGGRVRVDFVGESAMPAVAFAYSARTAVASLGANRSHVARSFRPSIQVPS